MRRWIRATITTQCGARPEHLIQVGEPMQVLEIQGMKRSLVRCVQCAQGDPPPDLPQVAGPKQSFTKPMKPLKQTAQDWKAKAAGR